MRLPQLDDRLKAAAAFFPACDYGADIGADHGRLSCYLLAQNVCRRMAVTDLSADSLAKAKRLLSLHGLSDRADFSVGDGLHALNRPADAIAVLGMGGRTVSKILRDGADRLGTAALILSAHTEMFMVRSALTALSYRIEKENAVRSAGRFYIVMRAVPGEESYTEKQLFLGPRLMECNTDTYKAYLSWQKGVLARGRGEETSKKLQWIGEEEKRVSHSEGN